MGKGPDEMGLESFLARFSSKDVLSRRPDLYIYLRPLVDAFDSHETLPDSIRSMIGAYKARVERAFSRPNPEEYLSLVKKDIRNKLSEITNPQAGIEIALMTNKLNIRLRGMREDLSRKNMKNFGNSMRAHLLTQGVQENELPKLKLIHEYWQSCCATLVAYRNIQNNG